jgi:hypothetical protein
MATAEGSAASAAEPTQVPVFAVGDRVMINRELSHPAWMHEVDDDPRNDSPTLALRPGIEKKVGEGVVERVERQWHRGTLVFVSNHFWYDIETGIQDGSGATFIVKITDD